MSSTIFSGPDGAAAAPGAPGAAALFPKIELHVHLEATVRPATLLAVAHRNGYRLPADTVEGLAELCRFRDFAHFLSIWMATTPALQTADDFRRVVVDYAAEAVIDLFQQRSSVRGLRFVYHPPALAQFVATFEPV